jgi:phage tail tape-measure protein
VAHSDARGALAGALAGAALAAGLCLLRTRRAEP